MSNIPYPGDAQFGNLIQAATAADLPQQIGADPQAQDASQDAAQNAAQNTSVLGKRARSEDETVIDTQLRAHPASVSLAATPTHTITSNARPTNDPGSILYRDPSENSTRYSRPVLQNVYKNLQMASDNYLRFLTAVKAYMLDENYPERRNVIGQKKDSNDTDAAKLRLYGIVQAFMNENNNGERFFGPNASLGMTDAPQRTFFWPENSHDVYSHSMPVFRKMITNERQRIYAAETRKLQGGQGKKKVKKTITSQTGTASPTVVATSAEQNAVIDQSRNTLTAPNGVHQSRTSNDQGSDNFNKFQQVLLHVNIVSDDPNTCHRLKPKLSILSESVMSLSALVAEVNNKCGLNLPIGSFADDDIHTPMVKALIPDGLVRVKDDGQWMMALATASMVDWMDNELKVVIEINPVMAL